jgi:hypothetical protein
MLDISTTDIVIAADALVKARGETEEKELVL